MIYWGTVIFLLLVIGVLVAEIVSLYRQLESQRKYTVGLIDRHRVRL